MERRDSGMGFERLRPVQCSFTENWFRGDGGGERHSLGLKDVDTSVEDAGLVSDFIQIQSVAPSPFSMTTSVVFQSPGLSTLTLQVYDTAGRLVRTQPLGNSQAGQHIITSDGRDASGAELASGVYFIRLQGVDQQASTKVVLVR